MYNYVNNNSRKKQLFHAFFLIGIGLILILSSNKAFNRSGKERHLADFARFQTQYTQVEKATSELVELLDEENFEKETYRFAHKDIVEFCTFKNGYPEKWTGHQLNFEDHFLQPDSSFLCGSGWFRKVSKGTLKDGVCAFIRLKSQYPIENRYLKNQFPSKFSAVQNWNISRIDSSTHQLTFGDEKLYFHPPAYFQAEKFHGWFIVQFMGLILFIIGVVHLLFRGLSPWLSALPLYFVSLLSIALLRWLAMHFHVPSLFDSQIVLGPEIYASSVFVPSMGDLLLYAFGYFICTLYYNGHKNHFYHKWIPFLYGIMTYLGSLLTFLVCKNLVLHSNISFDPSNILEYNVNNTLALFIIILFLASYIIQCFRYIRTIYSAAPKLTTRHFSQLAFTAIVICLVCSIWLWASGLIGAWGISISIISYLIIRREYNAHRFTFYLICIGLCAFFLSLAINSFSIQKEIKSREKLALRISSEFDPVAEYLLPSMYEKIENDTVIKSLITNTWQARDTITERLFSNYFHGIWDKYDLYVTPCHSSDTVYVPELLEENSCVSYFDNKAADGTPLVQEKIHRLEGKSYQANYLLKIQPIENHHLFIELFLRSIHDIGLGYPELLFDKSLERLALPNEYSMAEYHRGKLLHQSGNFSYPTSDELFPSEHEKFSEVYFEGFDHLIFQYGRTKKVVISQPTQNFYSALSSFAYYFLLLSILTLIYFGIVNAIRGVPILKNNFRNRVQAAMIVILLCALTITGIGSVYYLIDQNEKKNFDTITDKIQSVLIEMEEKYSLNPDEQLANRAALTNKLSKWSYIFLTDINLYSREGFLMASSRPELFDKEITGYMMNPTAFKVLKQQNKSLFIQKEKIGTLRYISAYIPFYDASGKLAAYINLPYFAKHKDFQSKLSSFIVATINIYTLLLIVSISISLLIYNRLTHPLIVIRDKMRSVGLGEKNDPIRWDSKDEIGELIQEYNRMIRELEQSAKKLARSERQSAWKEMAKQVAHEIKNPLTPMKLSIQFLLRAWDPDDPNWEQKLQKVSRTLIEQIDTLSHIASQFSNFAQMPEAHIQTVNLTEILTNTVHLYQETPNIEISISANSDYYVQADKEQLVRVCNNLVKNAIQSIPEDNEKGKITVGIHHPAQHIEMWIKDNGKGIPDDLKSKIFEPNFTTKSSGMGLGLAMCKQIIENTGGSIRFESQEDVGTIFHLTFPPATPPN